MVSQVMAGISGERKRPVCFPNPFLKIRLLIRFTYADLLCENNDQIIKMCTPLLYASGTINSKWRPGWIRNRNGVIIGNSRRIQEYQKRKRDQNLSYSHKFEAPVLEPLKPSHRREAAECAGTPGRFNLWEATS